MIGNRWGVTLTWALIFIAGLPAPGRGAEPPRNVALFNRMPKPALLPDGTLAAYFLDHRGPGLAATPEVQTVAARYSTDDGLTWSEPEDLFTLPAEQGGFGANPTERRIVNKSNKKSKRKMQKKSRRKSRR